MSDSYSWPHKWVQRIHVATGIIADGVYDQLRPHGKQSGLHFGLNKLEAQKVAAIRQFNPHLVGEWIFIVMENLGDFLPHDRLGHWIELTFRTDRDKLPHKIYLSRQAGTLYQTFRFLPKLGIEMGAVGLGYGQSIFAFFFLIAMPFFVQPIQWEMRGRPESDLFIFEVKAYWQS